MIDAAPKPSPRPDVGRFPHAVGARAVLRAGAAAAAGPAAPGRAGRGAVLRRPAGRSPTRWSSRSPASPSSTTRSAGASRACRRSGRTSPRRARGSRSATSRSRTSSTSSSSGAASRRWCSTSTAPSGRVELPVAVVAERRADGRIEELRIYFSSRPLTGRHADRPPLLQPDPGLRGPTSSPSYQRALAAGDVDAIVATFEPDGYAREPDGRPSTAVRTACAPSTSVVLQRRRHRAGALQAGRRRAHLRPGVQRRALGRDASCRRRPGSPSTSAARAEARRGPDLRRRRPAAGLGRLSQPWKGEWSPASQASRSPGALRSQSGRISRVTARRSCQRSTIEGRPQNQ